MSTCLPSFIPSSAFQLSPSWTSFRQSQRSCLSPYSRVVRGLTSRPPRITKVTEVPFIKWCSGVSPVSVVPRSRIQPSADEPILSLAFLLSSRVISPICQLDVSHHLKLNMLKGRRKTSSEFFSSSHAPFIYLAARGLSCVMRNLVPCPGIKRWALYVGSTEP